MSKLQNSLHWLLKPGNLIQQVYHVDTIQEFNWFQDGEPFSKMIVTKPGSYVLITNVIVNMPVVHVHALLNGQHVNSRQAMQGWLWRRLNEYVQGRTTGFLA